MGKRQEAALETKRKIIESMKLLLQEKNADCIGIEEITMKAGVAKGSFYTYFKRKEDVISVIAMDCYNNVKETVLNSSGSVYEQLCSYLQHSAKIIKKNTLQIAQNWMKSVTAPLPDEQGGIEKYTFDHDNIRNILEKAVQKGELGADAPVEVITENIVNCYYGTVAAWCITKGEAELVKGIDKLCEYGLKILIENYKNKEDSE